MISKLIYLSCVATFVASAPAGTDVVPLEKQQPTVIPIVSQSEEFEPNGTYKFSYETGNGIKREETAYDKVIPKTRSGASSDEGGEDDSDEIHVQIGSYSYTAPDGSVISVRYIADENGFQPIGDHIPKGPIPANLPSNSGEKSGRALKPVDSTSSGSEPNPVKVAALDSRIGEEAKQAPVSTQAAASKTTASADQSSTTKAVSEAASENTSEPSSESTSVPASTTEASGEATTELSSTTAASTDGTTTDHSTPAPDASTTELALSTTESAASTTESVSSTTEESGASTTDSPSSTDATS